MKDLPKNMFGVSAHIKRITEVELSKIAPSPDQPRKVFDEESIAELAATIQQFGLLQPVLLRKAVEGKEGAYIIVAGERRWRACQNLAWVSMDAIVIDGKNADEIAIIENMQRENLRPLEEAEAVGTLIRNHNYTQDDAARILGKSRSSITELLGLLRLPEAIRAECRTFDIPKSTLLAISRMNAEGQGPAFEAAKNGGISVRAAKAIQKRDILPDTGGGTGQGASPASLAINAAVKGLYAFAKRAGAHQGEVSRDDLKVLRAAKKQVDDAYRALTAKAHPGKELDSLAQEETAGRPD